MNFGKLTTITMLLLATTAAPASTSEVGGKSSQFLVRTSTDPIVTTTNVWAPIDEMETNIRTRGRGPIVITFCAETEVEGTLMVNARFNGALAMPGSVIFDEDFTPFTNPRTQSHCHIFSTAEVAPGTYNIQMEWSKIGTAPGSGFARMMFRTMKIDYP